MLTFSNLPLIYILYTIILESYKQISHSNDGNTNLKISQSTSSLLSINNESETSLASSTNDEIDFVSETLKARSAAPRQKS